MAASFVRDHGSPSIKTAGATNGTILTGATGPDAGNVLVARILYDNAAVSGKPIVSSIGKPAGETANWVFLGRANSTSTTLGALGYGEMWAIKTTIAWPANTSYTVTLDTATPVMKATSLREFTGVEAALRGTAGTAYSTTTTAASASTSGTAPQVGDLALGFLWGSNVAAAQAGDNDTTAGSWSTPDGLGSTGGNAATNNFGIGQYKVLTAATAQTYNNQAAMTAGNGVVVAILQQTPPPGTASAPTVSIAGIEELINVTTPAAYPSNTTSWDLRRSIDGGAYANSQTGIGLSAAYQYTGGDATKSYTFLMRAINGGGFTDGTASAGIVPNPKAPSFTAAGGDTTVDVSITGRAYAAKYKVYRRLTSVGGAYTLVHTSATQTASATYNWQDTGLTNGVSYDYVVSTEAQTPTVRESTQSALQAATPVASTIVRPTSQGNGGWTPTGGGSVGDNSDASYLQGNSSLSLAHAFFGTLGAFQPLTGGTFKVCVRYKTVSGTNPFSWTLVRNGGFQGSGTLDGTTTLATWKSSALANSWLGTDSDLSDLDLSLSAVSTTPNIQIMDVWLEVQVEAVPAPVTPNAPAVDQTNADGIQVRWNSQGYVANSTSYTIERSPNGTTGWTTVATGVNRAEAYWRDWGLSPSTTYYYRLTAVGPGGSSSPSAVDSGTTAAVSTVSNNFDGQTNGTTWTPANSDDTSGDLLTQSGPVGTVPTTYDNTVSLSGGSLKVALPATGNSNTFIYPGTGTWEQGRSSYFRGYVRSDLVVTATPSVNIMQLSGQSQFYLRWAPASGTLYVVDGSGVTKVAFTGVYDLASAFVRIEVYAHYDGMVSSWDLRVFVGANLHGTTPDESINWTYNDNTSSVATSSVGPGGYSTGTACNVWWDEIKWSDDTWIGPAPGYQVTPSFAAFGVPL